MHELAFVNEPQCFLTAKIRYFPLDTTYEIGYTISMVITYYGGQFVKIQHGDLVIAYNPAKELQSSDARLARFGADIALVSLNHPHFNGVENLEYGDKKPFTITGPGEYETKDVYVRGLETRTGYGGSAVPRLNTVYYILVEGTHLCFLGAVDSPTLPEKVYEAVHDVDILFVPVGGREQGGGVLQPAEAHKLSLTFSPRLIVPLSYDKETLKKFLREAGQEDAGEEEKLVLKKKDLEGKEGIVVVLKIA